MKTILMFLFYFMIVADSSAGDNPKRGGGIWTFPGAERSVRLLNVPWVYDWNISPVTSRQDGVEFVPMVWGLKDVTDAGLQTGLDRRKILLGFNEPDQSSQSNMTVDLALKLWPKLVKTGLRLGSPASAGRADDPNGWLARFMKCAKSRNLRVDFICLHYYDSNYSDPISATERLKQYIQNVHRIYSDKPIWLTEFGMSNWKKAATPDQLKAFLTHALPMLDSISYLERYAWFAVPPDQYGDSDSLSNSNLSQNDGQLTPLGIIYKNTAKD